MFKQRVKWHKIYDDMQELEARLELNKTVLLRINNKKICLGRNASGYYAVADKCPHQGASLSSGVCSDGGYFECPWHKYRFDVQTGRDIAGQGDNITVFPIRVDAEGVFVGMEYLAFTLFDWLGDD